MGVFISWSGKNTKSYLVADALRRWLEQVIQGCNPWMSSRDIEPGERWASELFAHLDNHSLGIICVTKANQGNPWLNFEAGILAKQLKGDQPGQALVCPLLIDMTESDLTGPLTLLQYVVLGENGVFKVLQMVNKYAIPKPLNEEVLRKAFNKWWPDFQTDLDQMEVPEQSGKSSRAVPEMLEEILGVVRSIDKAANRPSPISYLTIGEGITPPYSASVEHLSLASLQQIGSFLAPKDKLIAEVRKTDPLLAQALSAGTVTFDDQTLTINVRQIIPEQRLELAYKAATSLGIPLKILHTP